MKLGDGKIWPLAFAVSIGLHLAVLWPNNIVMSAEDGEAPQPVAATRLSFKVAAKPKPPKPEPVVKPQPRQPQPRPQEPVPPLPRQIVEQVATVEPATDSEPEPVVEQESTPVAAVFDEQEVSKARQQYLGKLLAHIEERKFYPRTARRRGLQGVIQVSFLVHDNGQVSGVTLANGHEVLRQAAADAVKAALPMPLPPREVVCPLAVSFGMEFKLN